MVQYPTVPECPLKNNDQNLTGIFGIWTWDLRICHCLTFEPLCQIQSVAHVNSLEFSKESNGTMSESPRVSVKKLWPKLGWNCWDLNLGPWHLPLCQIQNVALVNSLEFSRESNGTISNSPRVSLTKIQPKLDWNRQDALYNDDLCKEVWSFPLSLAKVLWSMYNWCLIMTQ